MKKSILTIILLFVFWSCGSRKAEKTKIKEIIKNETVTTDKSKTSSESNVKIEVIEKTDNKDETVTETTIYTPVDPTQPSIVIDEEGNTHSLNNTVYRKERTTKKNNNNSTTNKKEELTDKEDILNDLKTLNNNFNKSESDQRNIERQAWSLWNLLWLLIPIGLIIVLFKYKGNIWWVNFFNILYKK